MKVAILSTCYEKHIQYLYKTNNYIKDLDHKAELQELLKLSASHFPFWIQHLEKHKIETQVFCHDLPWLTKKWSEGKDKTQHLPADELFIERIKLFEPHFLLVFSPHYYKGFIQKIKQKISSVRLIAWYGANQGDERSIFSQYDLTLTNSHILRDQLINMGIKSETLKHSFEPRLFQLLGKPEATVNQKNRLVFAGTLGLGQADHRERTLHLEELAKSVPIDLFSDDSTYTKSAKQILLESRFKLGTSIKKFCGKNTPSKIYKWSNESNLPHFPEVTSPSIIQSLSKGVYGLEMFNKLSTYQICFNFHNKITGDSACNMRLFESTGMGCCLLTDHKSDIQSIFEPDIEVVTYKTPSEAIDKAKYLLKNPNAAQKIAKAGQQKTFSEHTTEKQVDQLAYHLKNLWN